MQDITSGNDYGQRESSDGRGTVRGEYRVLLPDSRTQIVRYMADDANGYIADVRYEGQAQFPRANFFPGGQRNNNGVFFPTNTFAPRYQQGDYRKFYYLLFFFHRVTLFSQTIFENCNFY